MEFAEIVPSEIIFKEKLSCSRYSSIFVVAFRDNTYILKVVSHHGRGSKQYYESPHRETNPHTCEATAYRRLQDHAPSKEFIPRFYGTIDSLDPKLHQPDLNAFLQDEYPPKGILLEYIPNMRPIHRTNYTKEKMENFIRGIKAIHMASVEHSDIHPRNMMVVDSDPERAIWIDFDRAQTLDADQISEEQRGWLAFETDLVTEMDSLMISSSLEGTPKAGSC